MGHRARTSHRPYSGRASPEDSAEHSRGDGLSSPCSGRCLVRQDMRSSQKSYAHLRASPPGARIVSSATMKGGRVLPKNHLSLSPHAFASRSSAMPFPRLASNTSWSWGSCNARFDHRYLDCLRRSVLLHQDRIKLSSSKKNPYHFDKVLISEPLSKPSTGPSIQSLY